MQIKDTGEWGWCLLGSTGDIPDKSKIRAVVKSEVVSVLCPGDVLPAPSTAAPSSTASPVNISSTPIALVALMIEFIFNRLVKVYLKANSYSCLQLVAVCLYQPVYVPGQQ